MKLSNNVILKTDMLMFMLNFFSANNDIILTLNVIFDNNVLFNEDFCLVS